MKRIRIAAERVDSNPHMPHTDMDHWKCLLRYDGRQMTVFFSMGYGHHGKEPAVADVIDCLLSDAEGVRDGQSFTEWCSEYGYDSDSRTAERIYQACVKQAAHLRRFLGADYDAFASQT